MTTHDPQDPHALAQAMFPESVIPDHTYTFHTDPGHGWLAVPVKEINELGIRGQITPYSYIHGELAFLEEDCDAATFMQAKKARGEPVRYVTKNIDTEHWIRRCRRFA